MAKKKEAGYLSGKEIRAISKANRKITGEMEKKWKRKNVPEEEPDHDARPRQRGGI